MKTYPPSVSYGLTLSSIPLLKTRPESLERLSPLHLTILCMYMTMPPVPGPHLTFIACAGMFMWMKYHMELMSIFTIGHKLNNYNITPIFTSLSWHYCPNRNDWEQKKWKVLRSDFIFSSGMFILNKNNKWNRPKPTNQPRHNESQKGHTSRWPNNAIVRYNVSSIHFCDCSDIWV